VLRAALIGLGSRRPDNDSTLALRTALNTRHGISGSEKGRPRRGGSAAGLSPSAVAGLPERDVGGAVLGRLFELDEAAA
jgi:hypothetical protein